MVIMGVMLKIIIFILISESILERGAKVAT